MKKVFSGVLASAMVLSMGASAFADISFSSNSNNSADWPNEFGFGGKLTVLDSENAVLSDINLDDSERITVYPGSTIYMPLYHNVLASEPVVGESGEPEVGVVQYKGKIDKNWKINFVEKSKRFLETAEFYKASNTDKNLTNNGVYVKVTVVDELDSVEKEEINYGVFISEKGTQNKTAQAYVKGDFSNPMAPNYVDFDWANQVYSKTVWEVEKGTDGTATFNFNDDASYTVKMFGEEKVLLDLTRDYDKNLLTKYNEDLEFFNFNGSHDTFSTTGTLSLPADKGVFVYENTKNGLNPITYTYNDDTEMVEFKTRTLNNYVISPKELDTTLSPDSDSDNNDSNNDSNSGSDNTENDSNSEQDYFGGNSSSNSGSGDKTNPSTGADDFVGAAAALAVVSLVAGVALLKK